MDVQCKNTIGAFRFYIKEKRAQIDEWKKKYILNKPKSTIVFIHLPNKCHNIFTKYLFLVLVGYNFIFYYLFWLIKNWHLNNCENIVKFVMLV